MDRLDDQAIRQFAAYVSATKFRLELSANQMAILKAIADGGFRPTIAGSFDREDTVPNRFIWAYSNFVATVQVLERKGLVIHVWVDSGIERLGREKAWDNLRGYKLSKAGKLTLQLAKMAGLV